jgi:hypothetical protein
MNTEDLLNALAADVATPPPRAARDWSLGVAGGALFSLVALLATLKARSDIAAVALDPRFDFKFLAALSLAVPAVWLSARLARPGSGLRGGAWLAVAPALLAVVCLADLLLTPEATWRAQAAGQFAPWCVVCVPLASLAPLAGILHAMSRGAPTNQRLAGLIAGLAAGGVGAFVYALHCTDDSPLFVATWYSLGVAIMGAIGAALGPRVLRW